MDLPAVFVDFNEKNKDKGWDVRINRGLGLFGEYHFSEVNRQFFLGAQLSIQEFKIENEASTGSQQYSNALAMGYGGYALQPFDVPLYVKVWGGIGYTDKISGTNVLGEQVYDIAPVSVFATVHLGYTF